MEDNKVTVKEALDKLYDLSWMVGSTAMEYLTDKDGEKIRDYIGVIEDRINDLEKELSEFKKYFEPYDIDEETAEAIIRSKCPNIDSAKDYIQSRLAEDDPMNFSVGKIVHDLIAKELTEDVKKQILEEEFGYGKSENSRSSDNRCDWCVSMVQFLQKLCVNRG